ncbi:ABC transporter ATP-binding protein [Orbaceae bacterium ESL0727]|nr:ABC transporter ATP-binding protein [Orbaceae bacterium ESL0727]
MATLTINHLHKSFTFGQHKREILTDVNLSIKDNEFVSVVGASGCGKSTLLSIIAGLEPYDSGEVLVDNNPIYAPGLDRGVVFQSYTLLPWLTVQKNIEFALKAAGYAKNESIEIAKDHLDLVNLSAFANVYPNQLSGGMKQRVALARAISYRPKILLMDEPFGALDAITRNQMQELLTKIWEQHRLTVLFITHDVEEAIYLSDRIILLSVKQKGIKSIFDVNQLRPRNKTTLSSTHFISLQEKILDEINQDID